MIDSIGCEKAVLHQVIRTAKQKQLFMFLYWLGLLPQMQAFEHRLFETRGRDKTFVTTSCSFVKILV
ncbi:hypothetical protein CUT02_01355 [Enterococcus faecium]|nr:hypothetical protein CUT02_01355 [Enterococcus faecium]PQF65741.1 hypothetical protein CUS78_04670 [Enterococcus faecium]RXW76431.1 hypothetical protein CYQ66_06350 [Enterococcus faecium]